MSKKDKIIITSLIIVAILSFTWAVFEMKALASTEEQMEYNCQRGFYDLINSIENLSVITAKTNVAASPEYTIRNLTEVYRHANAAAATLAALPLQHETLTRTERFLNQSGDHAHFLLRKLLNNEPLSKENQETMQKLSEQTRMLASQLLTLQEEIDNGNLSFYRSKTAHTDNAITVDSSFTQINEDIRQYPTLIYDGPFSDHMEQQAPQGITGEAISAQQALEKLKTLTDVMHNETRYGAEYTAETTANATIPIYCFDLKPTNTANTEQIHVDISKTGGHVIMVSNSRDVEYTAIDEATAKEKAQKFLASLGYSNMQDTYATTYGNTITLAFVATTDDILLYPDQIKIKIALDDGQILGLEAAGYFMSHKERTISIPQISQEAARSKVNSKITIEHEALALIPSEGGSEVLCYEFRGTYNNDTYIVYINAETGTEQNILEVIDTEGGRFTM